MYKACSFIFCIIPSVMMEPQQCYAIVLQSISSQYVFYSSLFRNSGFWDGEKKKRRDKSRQKQIRHDKWLYDAIHLLILQFCVFLWKAHSFCFFVFRYSWMLKFRNKIGKQKEHVAKENVGTKLASCICQKSYINFCIKLARKFWFTNKSVLL